MYEPFDHPAAWTARTIGSVSEFAVTLDGRLIDIASIKQAENLVNKAKQIAGG